MRISNFLRDYNIIKILLIRLTIITMKRHCFKIFIFLEYFTIIISKQILGHPVPV